MKKPVLLTLSVMLLAPAVSAYTVLNTATGEIEESSEIPEIIRTVEHLANGTKVTYTIDKVLLNPDPIVEGAYYPTLSEFGQTSTEGEPWLPIRMDRFAVANSSGPYFQIVEEDVVCTQLKVSPARAPHSANQNFHYTSANLPPVSASSSFYPNAPLSDSGCQIYRNNSFFRVTVSPMQYCDHTGTLKIYKKLSYTVENTLSSSEISSKTLSTDNVYKALNITHTIKAPNSHYFFITLRNESEVLDYKTILKTY